MSALLKFKPIIEVSDFPHTEILNMLPPNAKGDGDDGIANKLTPTVVLITAPHDIRNKVWNLIIKSYTGKACYLVGGYDTLIFICPNVGHGISELVSIADAALLLAQTEDVLSLWEKDYVYWQQQADALIYDETEESINEDVFNQYIRLAIIDKAASALKSLVDNIHYHHMHYDDTPEHNQLICAEQAIKRLQDLNPQSTFLTRSEWETALDKVDDLYSKAKDAYKPLAELSNRYKAAYQRAQDIAAEFCPSSDSSLKELYQAFNSLRNRIIALRDEMDRYPKPDAKSFNSLINDIFDFCPGKK
jgi:hypothetical protein